MNCKVSKGCLFLDQVSQKTVELKVKFRFMAGCTGTELMPGQWLHLTALYWRGSSSAISIFSYILFTVLYLGTQLALICPLSLIQWNWVLQGVYTGMTRKKCKENMRKAWAEHKDVRKRKDSTKNDKVRDEPWAIYSPQLVRWMEVLLDNLLGVEGFEKWSSFK